MQNTLLVVKVHGLQFPRMHAEIWLVVQGLREILLLVGCHTSGRGFAI